MDIVREVINKEEKAVNLGRSFVSNFVRRHPSLFKIIQDNVESTREERRNFECEFCKKKFTFKNSLVAHRRNVHSAFYI